MAEINIYTCRTDRKRLQHLARELASQRRPRFHEEGDGRTSEAAQARALSVLHRAQAVRSRYITSAPVSFGKASQTLPANWSHVSRLAHALESRALWLHGAWLKNQYPEAR